MIYLSYSLEGVIEKGPLAHLVEHLPLKQGVAGSSPARLIICADVAELPAFVYWAI